MPEVTITCPECGHPVTVTHEREGGFGDDGQGIRDVEQSRVGCEHMDIDEILEVANG